MVACDKRAVTHRLYHHQVLLWPRLRWLQGYLSAQAAQIPFLWLPLASLLPTHPARMGGCSQEGKNGASHCYASWKLCQLSHRLVDDGRRLREARHVRMVGWMHQSESFHSPFLAIIFSPHMLQWIVQQPARMDYPAPRWQWCLRSSWRWLCPWPCRRDRSTI